MVRSLAGTIGILCNFYAVDHLVLADASMLNKMSPFFAIIFSYFLLKEKVTPVQILAVLGAFAGSLLIIKPSFDFAKVLPASIGLLGGIMAGSAYTCVRMLGKRGVPGSFIVVFFSAFSCLATLPNLIFNYEPMSLYQWAMLILAGVSASIGQFGITAAYRFAPARQALCLRLFPGGVLCNFRLFCVPSDPGPVECAGLCHYHCHRRGHGRVQQPPRQPGQAGTTIAAAWPGKNRERNAALSRLFLHIIHIRGV